MIKENIKIKEILLTHGKNWVFTLSKNGILIPTTIMTGLDHDFLKKNYFEVTVIYGIRCLANGCTYLGCTTNFYNRCREHLLCWKTNKNLLKDLLLYGKDNFEVLIFVQALETDMNHLVLIESLLIKALVPVYNIRISVPSFLHRTHSDETPSPMVMG